METESLLTKASIRSTSSGAGTAGTAIVTATNAGLIAAAFLGHSDEKVTQKYYHKGDDAESLSLIGPLTSQLSGGPPAAGRRRR